MKFKVLTLFPEMVLNGLNTSILGRAIEKKRIEIETLNIRDYTEEKHGKVDDYTYGGGAGMLMQVQPVYDAWQAALPQGIEQDHSALDRVKKPRTIYVTPQGRLFDQRYAQELSQEKELIILCGHYEGIDQRVLDEIVTDYVSVGDYVLTGGELPAMVLIDAISRLVPGVLHNGESAETESFHRSLLEYPQYTRPELWHSQSVPEVLLSGDHRRIAAWRKDKSIHITKERRPDLYEHYLEQEKAIQQLSHNKRLYIHMMESLRRGMGELLLYKENAVFIYSQACRMGLFALLPSGKGEGDQDDIQSGLLVEQMLDGIPASIRDFIRNEMCSAMVTSESLKRVLEEQYSMQVTAQCIQACYTQKNPLPVRFKAIRPIGEELLDYHPDYFEAHYKPDERELLRERIQQNALFGAFWEDNLIGTAGWGRDGGIQFLYVEEKYRNQGIGASLEAYCINRQLEQGQTPYIQMDSDNMPFIHLQEKLGLLLSREYVWLLKKYNASELNP